MRFERRFTTTDRPVAEQIEWKTVPAMVDRKQAALAEVEVPAHWSQNAANIFADMYLRKAGVPTTSKDNDDRLHGFALYAVPEEGIPGWLWRSKAGNTGVTGAETSARQVFHRLAGAWTYHGWVEGYFFNKGAHVYSSGPTEMQDKSEEYARAFYDEVYWCLAMQLAAPNSPQWFNTGLWWAYGIEGPDTGMWRVRPGEKKANGDEPPVAERVPNSYQYPQPHACFLTSTADELVGPGGIMDTWVREARIFKHGSGSGINPSVWRGVNEPLSGGGRASGMMSWLSIGDKAAGATKSGGTNRRAAKMICVDDDHPELIEFIRWKAREEGKAEALDVGSQVLRNHFKNPGYYLDTSIEIAQPMLDRLAAGMEPEPLPVEWESEAMRTVDGQNSNTSVRPTDRFMRAVNDSEPWRLTARTTGETTRELPAREVWDEICQAAWASGDPALLFHDTINAWHTTPADGPIRTTNPCAEFHSNDSNACNLASLRLTGFLREDGTIDIAAYEHVCRLFTLILDISNSMASFPAAEFALGAYNYRTIGLGYMDLGGLLMRLALPYDSSEGRSLAAAMTALMTGVAYRTSAEMAEELGPFPRFAANEESFRAVMEKHHNAIPSPSKRTDFPKIWKAAKETWEAVVRAKSFRNAQATLQAPTGTIHLVTNCDTSGIEPDYALVKHKQLAGGGSMTIVNQAVPAALRRLGYDERTIELAVRSLEIDGDLTHWAEWPKVRDVFACVAELRPMANVEMLAAIQPFLSGASSKTVNLPNDATVEDISNIYFEAWRRGVKAIAVYRDGSKLTQPLAATAPKPAKNGLPPLQERELSKEEVAFLSKSTLETLRDSPGSNRLDLSVPLPPILARGVRERLPPRRTGVNQKMRIAGQTLYLRSGEYPDGRLAEVFIDIDRAGSMLDGLANSLAKVMSVALQYGTPAEEIVDALLEVRFEPSGHVELHDRVKWSTSLVDLIARHLAIDYLGREDLANVVRAVAVDSEAVVALDRRAVAVAQGRPTGESCARCGGTMVQTGRGCKTCVDCGQQVGGCG